MKHRPASLRCQATLVSVLLLGAFSTSAQTLIVANKSDDTVDLIDLSSGESRATLATGHAPHEIAVSPDGATAVVTNYGDRETPGHTLTVVDVTASQVLRTIDLGKHERPHGIRFVGPDRVVVTTEGSAHLLSVDIAEGIVLQAIPTAQEVSHMVATAADGQRAFVANIGSGTVTVVDLASGEKITDLATGEGAEGIALHPHGREIWVGNRAADTLSIVDPVTLEIVASLPCPGFPIRIAFSADGSRALVSAARSGEVVVFDTGRRQETLRSKLDLTNAADAGQRLFGDRFGDSPVPVGLVSSPDGKTAWVAATQADVVVEVDPETLGVRRLLLAGREPDGMAYSALQAQP